MAAPAVLTSATSMEGQMFELARELKQAEDNWIEDGLALDPPVTRTRRVTLSVNPVTKVASITLTLPITESDAANGVSYAAAPYIL